MTKYYTGVGSRSTPQDIMELMTQVATKLEALGYSLRSGAADGADTGFELGITNPLNKSSLHGRDSLVGAVMRRECLM